jgi:hypothetical protein
MLIALWTLDLKQSENGSESERGMVPGRVVVVVVVVVED